MAIIVSVSLYSLLQTSRSKKILWALLTGYLFLVVSSTLLARIGSEQFRYNLKPFWTYYEIAKGTWRAKRFLEEVILNVIMLIPVGIIISCLVKNQKFRAVLVSGIGISMFIELFQLITKRGLFEFDDIIHNTMGAIIGYGIYKLMCVLKHRWMKNKKDIKDI